MQANENNRNVNDKRASDTPIESVKVGDRIFHKAKYGLIEEEVRSYVQELISQHESMVKRQEHLAALTELAEKTVIEANNLSQLMMKKSADQARAEGDKIKAQAEQDCKQMVEAKKNEAKAAAEKEVAQVKAEADQQVKIIRERQLEALKGEAALLSQKLQNELLTSLDAIKQQVLSIGANFDPKAFIDHENPVVILEGTTAQSKHSLTDNEKGVLLNHIPWLEIEILPPLDIEKVMELIATLEALPEVKTTDLLPETPNPLIRVFLNETCPLAELLRTLPLIAQVNEMPDDGEFDIQGSEKRKRIQIVLGKNPQTKEKENKKSPTSKVS
ncbi:MAG: hypothetical protein WCC72_09210 [Dehalococcoidales bacterium]|jgi:F0F1-type ATP synthase membrane subunit b/b'